MTEKRSILVALVVALLVFGSLCASAGWAWSFGQQNSPQTAAISNCEPPTPWQNVSSMSTARCRDIQSPEVSVNQGVVTLSLCGYSVWSYIGRASDGQIDNALNEEYKSTLTKWTISQVGQRICCDKFQEAIKTGKPCDPRVDVDCDGKPNGSDSFRSSDTSAPLPDINIFKRADGARVDPFPAGFGPDDPNFMPPADKCDCKWELVEGSLNCSSVDKQPHVYQTRWRCPSSGKEQFTRKEAPATAPCSKT